MRNIIVFGATGFAGLHVVVSGLKHGHAVTAFVRDPGKIPFRHPNLKVVQGDATCQGNVTRHMDGADAVVSALNAYQGSHRLLFIDNILNGMREHTIKRIIAIGGAGALQADAHLKLYETPNFPRALIGLSKAHERVLEALVASLSDYTYVCPIFIGNGKRTGIYEVRKDYPTSGMTIGAEDLADFIVTEFDKNAFVQAKVGISND